MDRAGKGRNLAATARRVDLKQTFQMISGTIRSGNVVTPITNGKLNSDQISFTAGNNQYTGRVNDNSMEGSAADRSGMPPVRPSDCK